LQLLPHIMAVPDSGMTLFDIVRRSADYRNSRWHPWKTEVVAAIFDFWYKSTSGNVDSVTDVSGMVANVG